MADLNAWRALVDKELAGTPFEKLVQRTAEGLSIQPLYTERPDDPPPPGAAPFVRGASLAPFKLCMRVSPGQSAADELDSGADALWCDVADHEALRVAVARGATVVLEPSHDPNQQVPDDAALGDAVDRADIWSSFDGVAEAVRGTLPPTALGGRWPVGAVVRDAIERDPSWRCVRIGALPFHDAGADAADELALTLSSLVATLRRLDDEGIDLARATRMFWAQVAIGRDTFGELCKLRALRLLWHKVFAAAGMPDVGLDAIHAVCSARTLSQRDPWVNMLRVTTQVFAAALGGAQLVTPLPFDAAFATPSALGQRVARNTALVLREESQLGRVLDAGGGSYYLETRTEQLAREAWSRFTAIEREGGIVQLLRSGALRARLDAAWAQRAAAIAKRKEPVLGVSDFANLTESLPGTPLAPAGVHRDAEAFEALRARSEASPRDIGLVQLGPPKEHRARAGFAEGFFGVAGLRATPREIGPGLDVACVCGSDERYATEAVATVRALRSAGARRIVVAGRPGDLEAELRAAGVDAFIYVGCDVLATLEEVLA